MELDSFLFRNPVFIKYGFHSANIIPDLCESYHSKKILFITGKHVLSSEAFLNLKSLLNKSGFNFDIFSNVPTEPTISMVNEASDYLKASRCDTLIAIGGGSVLDTAKAMAMLAVNPGSAEDYMFGGNGIIKNPSLPLICIPTTAGSGSEVTASSVILHEQRNVKLSITHDNLFPKYAIIDPFFQISMPHSVTISTGMDAMTHAIEAYTSNKGNLISDMYSMTAISMIAKNIKIVCSEPENITARGEMAIASTLAALAFVNGGLGAVHGISQAIGGIAHVPHGICNAILLPYVMELNSTICPDKFINIAKALDVYVASDSVEDNANHAVSKIKSISNEIGIPTSISTTGVTLQMFPDIIKETMNYRLLSCNPATITPEIIESILNKSYYSQNKGED